MKIAIITPGGVDRSGTQRVIPCLLWLIERLVREGNEVQIFALCQEDEPGHWDLLGARVQNAGRRGGRRRLAKMLLAEHRAGPFDILHAFWADPAGLIAGLVGRILGVPVLLTLPGGDAARVPAIRYGGRLTARGRIKLWITTRLAKRVTVPSEAMRRQVADVGINATCVPLGVALDRWPPRAPRPRDPAATLRLLHVASLNLVKDQMTLLRMAAILQNRGVAFALVIIGEDTLGGFIRQSVEQMGLSNTVRLMDFLPHERLRRWFEWADLLVVTSLYEAGPLVTLEAAVVGVPTIGTAVGHIKDLAPEAAVAVPPGDAEALAVAAEELGRDDLRRLMLGKRAAQFACDHDADATARAFRGLYGELRHGGTA